MSDKNAKIMNKVHVKAYERNPPGGGSSVSPKNKVLAAQQKARQEAETAAAKGIRGPSWEEQGLVSQQLKPSKAYQRFLKAGTFVDYAHLRKHNPFKPKK